jgi:hypothetical protein
MMTNSIGKLSTDDISSLLLARQLSDSKVGSQFGNGFEEEIQAMLGASGYVDLASIDDTVIRSIKINRNKADSEFDAIVVGDSRAYENFADLFMLSYTPSRPTSDPHVLIVETKLNHQLLYEWIEKSTGSCGTFFSKKYSSYLTKVLVLNGGESSKDFMKCLIDDLDIPKYNPIKEKIVELKINVFYKPWLSGETFKDMLFDNQAIRGENQEIEAKYQEMKAENQEMKAENQEIEAKYQDIMHKLEKIEALLRDKGLSI